MSEGNGSRGKRHTTAYKQRETQDKEASFRPDSEFSLPCIFNTVLIHWRPSPQFTH